MSIEVSSEESWDSGDEDETKSHPDENDPEIQNQQMRDLFNNLLMFGDIYSNNQQIDRESGWSGDIPLPRLPGPLRSSSDPLSRVRELELGVEDSEGFHCSCHCYCSSSAPSLSSSALSLSSSASGHSVDDRRHSNPFRTPLCTYRLSPPLSPIAASSPIATPELEMEDFRRTVQRHTSSPISPPSRPSTPSGPPPRCALTDQLRELEMVLASDELPEATESVDEDEEADSENCISQ